MFETFPKGSKTPHQNVDTQQEIGTDRFIPGTGNCGKDATPGKPSGKTSYPSRNRTPSISTQKHHANTRGPWASGGGNKQVSFTAPKSRTRFGTEKEVGKDKFVPKTKSDYGVGGV